MNIKLKKNKFPVVVSVLIFGIGGQLLCRCAGPGGLRVCGHVWYGGKTVEGGVMVGTNRVQAYFLCEPVTNVGGKGS
jgi:hypothetical protein